MTDEAGKLLAGLKSDLWLWRVARGTAQRRSLGMRVRWKLRKLAGSECYADACRMVQEAAKSGRRCEGCGRLLLRPTRLGIQERRDSSAI